MTEYWGVTQCRSVGRIRTGWRNLLILCTRYKMNFFFFTMAQQPLVGQDLLIVEASRSYSDTPHSVGLLWTSDQPDADSSAWKNKKTHKRQPSIPPPGFGPTIPASEQPQAHAFRRRGRYNQQKMNTACLFFFFRKVSRPTSLLNYAMLYRRVP